MKKIRLKKNGTFDRIVGEWGGKRAGAGRKTFPNVPFGQGNEEDVEITGIEGAIRHSHVHP